MTIPTQAELEATIATFGLDVAALHAVVTSNSATDVPLAPGVTAPSLAKVMAALLNTWPATAYATKALLDADLNKPTGVLAFVTNDTTAANNYFYRKTGGIGAGSWVPADTGVLRQILDAQPTLDVPRVVPHANFNFLPGRISKCPGPGQAQHDIDLNKVFDKNWGGDSGFLGPQNDAGLPNWNIDLLVNPVTGNDTTGTGRPIAPLKTVRQAVKNIGTSGGGSIWLDTGTYIEHLNLLATDAVLGGGQARAIKIRALHGRGSVVFANHLDSQPSTLTFTATTGGFTTTPALISRVQQVVWVRTNVETGRKTYSAVPLMTSAGNTTAFGFGWFQDTTTRLITISVLGKDFTQAAVKSEFLFTYFTGLGEYNMLIGTKLYLEGIDFVGAATLGIFWQPGRANTTLHRPVCYIQNCGFHFLEGSGIHPEGADLFVQNCDIQGNGNGDGINYYPDPLSIASGGPGPTVTGTSASTNAACKGLEIDLNIWDSGFINKFGPSTRNCQASSAHSGMTIIQINGNYRNSYGQNVAHVGATTYYWCVGGVFPSPFAVITNVAGAASVDGYNNVYLEGVCWLDTIHSFGVGSLDGLTAVPGSAIKVFNCDFRGYAHDINGTVTPYTPASP
jgi:hypothetical protein